LSQNLKLAHLTVTMPHLGYDLCQFELPQLDQMKLLASSDPMVGQTSIMGVTCDVYLLWYQSIIYLYQTTWVHRNMKKRQINTQKKNRQTLRQ